MSASGAPVCNESASFWLKNAKYENVQTTPFPQSVDIAIIGAGISGVSIAYHLIQYYTNNNSQCPDILLLDARGVSEGATGRNGGVMVISKNKEKITNQFEQNTFNDMISMIKQYKMEKYIGLQHRENKVTFCSAKIVFSLMDIIIKAYKHNLHLQTQTTVHNVRYNTYNNMHEIETKHHDLVRNINAKIVVYATNGYTSYLLPEYKNKIYPVKNQVLVTKPIIMDNDQLKQQVIGNDYDYYYQMKDGRILLGGGRNCGLVKNKWLFDYNDSVNKINNNVTNYLINTYLKQYNKRIEIENIWQGILGFTNDNLPYVGPLPNRRNCYICAGFNGHGMTFTFNCAKAIAEMIIGTKPKLFLQQFAPEYRLNRTKSNL